jgi:4-hydroxy-tetrahydrodipicolinate synthase
MITFPCVEAFAAVRTLLWEGNQEGAEAQWREVAELTRLLFVEPSPSPAKHWLWRNGLIDSPEVRLPMVEVSAELAATLDREIERCAPPLLRRA